LKFFAVFVFSVVFCFFVWLGLVLRQAGHPTKMSQWIFDAYIKKEQIAKQIHGKKIVLVGGSNVLFGVDSKLLSKAFGLSVLNDGVNAGIELPCILYEAKKVIRKGDIVIMSLEYPMYSYEGKPGVQMIDYVLSREPSCLRQLTWKEVFYIVWHVDFKRILAGYFDLSQGSVTKGVYGAQHIDVYGDQTETALAYRSKALYKEVLAYTTKPEKYGASFDGHALGWKYLAEFVQWCRKRDVQVVFMPSTLMRHASYFKNPKEHWFYTHIADEVRKRGWVFVGKPYDYMYPQEMYFNTNFHLIDKARKIRTLQMVKDLQAYGFMQK